ncbi:4953_t:CDS:2, partial [Racocetra fulgida]
NDIEKIKQISILILEKQYSANINASCEINSESNFKQINSQYDNTSISDITDNTSNSDEPDMTQCSVSICIKTKSSKDKEIKKFLDRVYKENNDSSIKYQEMISITNCNAYVTKPSSLKDILNIKASISNESSHTPSLEDIISEDNKSLLKTKVNTPANPTYDQSYFRNKINNNYYGITDESLCLLCKLDHDNDNGIEDRYEVGSYYIKCEQ